MATGVTEWRETCTAMFSRAMTHPASNILALTAHSMYLYQSG